MSSGSDVEMDAFKTIYEALEALEEEARERVFTSVATMLRIGARGTKSSSIPKTEEVSKGQDDADEGKVALSKYSAFAELYADADPTSSSDKALAAGYWLQVCMGGEHFSGFSINSELNNLGHRLSNVTQALSSLIKTKPQLVLQLKKTGKSQQARKTYKLSKAGIDRVEGMIGGSG